MQTEATNKPAGASQGVSRKMGRSILFYAVLLLGAVIAILPFLYMFANSLKTYSETVTRVSANPLHPRFWPRQLQWVNYLIVLHEESMGRYFLNSVVISAVTVGGLLFTSTLAAYAFAKIRFPGKDTIFTILLATLMIPETVLLIPNFLIVAWFGWLDRLPALTVPFMAGAFYIFLLRQFFNQIPDALVESARLDGCAHSSILVSIVLPLTSAPLFTAAFLAYNGAWNALQWPLVVTQTDAWRPITVGLTKFITEAGPETQLRMAGAMIALLPTVILFFFTQRQITEAIAKTGMKG